MVFRRTGRERRLTAAFRALAAQGNPGPASQAINRRSEVPTMPVRVVRAALPAAALALALLPAAPASAARQTECGARGHRTSAQDETWLTTGIQGDRFEIIG